MTENSREGYGDYSVDDENQLQPGDTLDDRGVGRPAGRGVLTAGEVVGRGGLGNTADEALQGESLDQRLRQEVPDVDPYAVDGENVGGPEVGSDRSGRLVAPDQGLSEDDEKDLVAEDIGIDGAAASAEEAAVHVVEDEDFVIDED